MNQVNFDNSGLLNLTELNKIELIQIEGGSLIGDIGEAVGGTLGFMTGLAVRVASDTAKVLTGTLTGKVLRY